MNGTTHATVGAATGFIIANTTQVDLSTTFIFIGLGTISALIPDLDIDGKLRGKMTLSHKMMQWYVNTKLNNLFKEYKPFKALNKIALNEHYSLGFDAVQA